MRKYEMSKYGKFEIPTILPQVLLICIFNSESTAVCKNDDTCMKIETYYDVAGLGKITPIGNLVESSAFLPTNLRRMFVNCEAARSETIM